eukprot:jgi/Bigna1/37808/e_gw1.22.118.1
MKSYWAASIVSTLHGFAITYWAFCAICEGNLWTSEDFFAHTPATTACCHVLLGYIFSDLLLALYYGAQWPGNVANVIHHTITVYSFGDMCTNKFAHGMAVMVMLLEATTPFINFRWFLSELGMKDSHPKLYLVNGLIMTIGWFILRICFCAWIGLRILMMRDQVKELGHLQLGTCIVTYGVGYGLQVFWFNKIMRGAMKILRKPKQQ